MNKTIQLWIGPGIAAQHCKRIYANSCMHEWHVASRTHAFSGEEKAWYNARFVPFAVYSANQSNFRTRVTYTRVALRPRVLPICPEHVVCRTAAARLGFETMKKEQEFVCRGKGCVCSPADRLWKQSLLLLPGCRMCSTVSEVEQVHCCDSQPPLIPSRMTRFLAVLLWP